MVLDPWTGQSAGIITEADIAHAVADGKDVNSTRIYEVMTTRPTVINTTTSVRDAAKVMTSGHFGTCRSSATPAWSASSTSPTCASHCSAPTFPVRPPTCPSLAVPDERRRAV
jgi:hypothetical protein